MDLRQVFLSELKRKHLFITTCIEKHCIQSLSNTGFAYCIMGEIIKGALKFNYKYRKILALETFWFRFFLNLLLLKSYKRTSPLTSIPKFS